ncbi:TRAP transporter small permease [Neotabrizicola shimadae]|uniref:TRAP transporter small permease protein n=1 Tax=Neotabrizicola shimadae TaxID=2807096 RepID=A0A8G1EBN0_9RHOB|nr:TRAP transporter small permease subunit [Neotabrizicola shimadae]QYZ69582.1 TRAP transporter small permease subunit [Neotabrizicola shimadae]
MIRKLNHGLELVCRVVSGASVVVMASVAFLDSIGRPLAHPLPGGSEMVSHALMLFFFSSLPLVVKADAHIRVGLLTDFYSAPMKRVEHALTVLLETLAMAVLAWMVLDQAARLMRFGTESVYFQMPVGPWVLVAGGFCVIAVWFALWILLAPATEAERLARASHADNKVE